MTYVKPPLFTRKVFNPIAMRAGWFGSQPLVTRRRSGDGTHSVPVIPVDHGGSRYVVSTRGESDWVRNARAAGAVELGGRPYRVAELPLEQRDAIIAAYREKAGKSVDTYWKKLPDTADHPVFRLDPAR